MSINIWTDSMQHAALLGKPVLFTNWLIQRDIIPDGWYCYDLRGTHKSPSTRTTLVDHAADYHAGTVLSPIPLKHEGIPINFDPDAVFGTNVASAFNDDWLNVYANFGWKTGRIDSALTVCLVCSDGHEFEFFYPLTSAEQVQLWNQMDAYCHQQNGQSLGETRTALLREQAEEGLEIRL